MLTFSQWLPEEMLSSGDESGKSRYTPSCEEDVDCLSPFSLDMANCMSGSGNKVLVDTDTLFVEGDDTLLMMGEELHDSASLVTI